MPASLQNIIIGVIGLLLVGLGYYLFAGGNSFNLTDAVSPVDDQVLMKTQVFIERRTKLQAVSITGELFNDPRFTALQSNSTILPEQPIGNRNLFVSPIVENVVAP